VERRHGRGGLPPASSPFAPDTPGGSQPEVPSVEGKDYVELGCGGGQGSVGTAELGARTVVGVDFSGEQLRHARQLRDLYGVEVRFVQGDVTNLPLADDRFDVASSEAAFQMVEHVDRALLEARRVLRDGGVFVFSVPHPLYEALDPETGTIERSYFDAGPREITIDEDYESVLTVFDRTVADLHNTLVDAGRRVRGPTAARTRASRGRGERTRRQRPARNTVERATERSVLDGRAVR
jgi:ubiquinone/menaquinone biosynthesis C-methylase UbiE